MFGSSKISVLKCPRTQLDRPGRVAVILVLAAGLWAMSVALGAQHLLGMAPCELCYWERWPYRMLIVLGIAGLILREPQRRGILVVANGFFIIAAGLAFLHVGVEHHWWPSPLPECNAPNLKASTLANLIASLPQTPSKPCDSPNFLISWLPISFATMDFLYAACAAAALTAFLVTKTAKHQSFFRTVSRHS